jgi:hypothetical protein
LRHAELGARLIGGCALAFGLLGFGTASARACLATNLESVVVEGVVDTLRGGHGSALILRPTEPVCLIGQSTAESVPPTTAIHVYGVSDSVMEKLMVSIRSKVHLTGRMFPPTNAHHKAAIVMEVTDVVSN